MSQFFWYGGIVRCLRCHGALHFHERGDGISCTRCDARYHVAQGVPLLIDSDASLFKLSGFLEERDTTYPTAKSRLASWVFRHLPSAEMNVAARANYTRLAGLLKPSAKVLVVGGGIDGDDFDVLRARTDLRILCTDVSAESATDMICDGHDLPFMDGAFDCVIFQAVLEHVLDPARCVAEARRVLADNGFIYAETPFMQPGHMGAYDFHRFTELGHIRLFRHFTKLDSGVACGCGSALCLSLIHFLQSFASSRKAKTLLHAFGRLLFFPLKYADILTHANKGSRDGAAGFFFLGQKASRPVSDEAILACYGGLG